MNSAGILVTGATGFVGAHLVPRLLAQRQRLTLLVRRADACPADWRGDGRIAIVETGPIEAADLAPPFAGIETVVHLAGLAHVDDGTGIADAFMRANATATERLAAAAEKYGAKTFVHLSSLASITDNASSAIVDDDTESAPATAYGRSKRLAEGHVAALAQKGLFAVSLRPPLVVGAQARGNWRKLQRLAATGLPLPFGAVRNRRSLIGVGALGEAISRLCLDQWPSGLSGNYCIADAEPLSLAEMLILLRGGMGLPPRLVPFPPSLLSRMVALAGRGRMAAGLFGDLAVDSSRFRRVFRFEETEKLPASIRASGMLYRRLERRTEKT